MGQKKCPECNSCLSHFWLLPNRYYYCGFCHTYYGGRDDNLQLVESPYKDKIESNKVEDPTGDNNESEERTVQS